MALHKFGNRAFTGGFQTGSASLGERLYWYYEGSDCRSYMSNWNYSSEQYNMTTCANLGNCWIHGWGGSARTYTLNVSGLAVHSQLRFTCYVHMVDSWDNEYNYININDNNDNQFEIVNWRKVYNATPNSVNTSNGGTFTWYGGQTYSYRPWGNGSYGNDGYAIVTSNYYNHSRSNFRANIYTGLDQGQGDEAFYISHVQIDLK